MTPILSTVYFGDALKIPNLLQTGPLEPGPEAPGFALLGKGVDSTPGTLAFFLLSSSLKRFCTQCLSLSCSPRDTLPSTPRARFDSGRL